MTVVQLLTLPAETLLYCLRTVTQRQQLPAIEFASNKSVYPKLCNIVELQMICNEPQHLASPAMMQHKLTQMCLDNCDAPC